MKFICFALISTMMLPFSDIFQHVSPVESFYYENDPMCEERVIDDYVVENLDDVDEDYQIENFSPIIGPGPIIQTPSRRHTYVGNSNFINYYFQNLCENIPFNHYGNCGYTAFTMLLSYYDTFWNDDFIPNIYSVNQVVTSISNFNDLSLTYESPGIRDVFVSFEPFRQYYGLNNFVTENDKKTKEYKILLQEAMLAWMNANYESGSFLGYLFNFALEEGIMVPQNDYSQNEGYIDGPGVSFDIMSGLFSKYVETLPFETTVSTFAVKNPSRQVIRESIIELVTAGIPVCVGGNTFEDKNKNNQYDGEDIDSEIYGHEVVAYDYDPVQDIIYCHLGWQGDVTYLERAPDKPQYELVRRANLDNYFNYKISDFFGINIYNNESVLHKHSNTYSNTSSNNNIIVTQNVCSCSLVSHTHRYQYDEMDSLKHHKQCFCNLLYVPENHSFYYNYIDGVYNKICGMCGYKEVV